MNDWTLTNVAFSGDARDRLYRGLSTAVDAIGCTLGPKGHTVLIQRGEGSPIVTKDGVTVSKSIRLKDPVERMGAELVREAAAQTNETAGDGTTTSSVLTGAMVREGLKLLNAGYTARSLRDGIELAMRAVDTALTIRSTQVTTTEKIAQVATVSANGDRIIGDLIARAMDAVGIDGVVTIEDARGTSTSLEIVEGMQFDRGYLSPYFVTNKERMQSVHNDVSVLITDKKLSNLRDLVPLLEHVVQIQGRLLIIADDVDGDALQGLVLNRVKSNIPVVAIKAPGYGHQREDALRDLCVLTGATLVSSSTGTSMTDAVGSLGHVKKVVVGAKSTMIVATGATKDAINAHTNDLNAQLADVTLDQDSRSLLRTRIAKLRSGVAVVRVGGATEIEMIERKYRIEDALNATRAAAEEGIIAGGGTTLVRIADDLRANIDNVEVDLRPGTGIVLNACYEPLRLIAENAGESGDVVINELRRRPELGYNAATGEYTDLVADGVIDPVKVTRLALRHAASVAITFLSLDAVVYQDDGAADRSEEVTNASGQKCHPTTR